MTCYSIANHSESEKSSHDLYQTRPTNRDRVFRQFELKAEENTPMRFTISDQLIENQFDQQDTTNSSNGDYNQLNQQSHNRHTRKESRGIQANFNTQNTGNSTAQTIMESIYGTHAVTKLLHNSQNWPNDYTRKASTDPGNIEMTSYFRNSGNSQTDYGMHSGNSTKAQGLQRVSQYIESLPDLPGIYDSMSDIQSRDDEDEAMYKRLDDDGDADGEGDDERLTGDEERDSDNQELNINRGRNVQLIPSPVPPPPAPPDPRNSGDVGRKNSPTTGERIFSALRSVTSQSYIDASEFYK